MNWFTWTKAVTHRPRKIFLFILQQNFLKNYLFQVRSGFKTVTVNINNGASWTQEQIRSTENTLQQEISPFNMVLKESGSATVVPVQIQWFSQGASICVASLSPTVLWLARSYMERKELNTKVWSLFFFQNSSGRGVHCSNQKGRNCLKCSLPKQQRQ